MSCAGRLGAIPILLFLCLPAIAADEIRKGMPLDDYIEILQRQGLRVIYSSDLVLDEYLLRQVPAASDPAIALREALAPHGLALADGPAGSLLVTRSRRALPPVAAAGQEADEKSVPEALPEIIVTSSLYNIRYEQAGSHSFLDRDLATKMPDLGDEALRAIARLPGTSGGGLSTRSHVRGGLQNEQLFLLDGLRLYEPYHMKDFHSIATIVDQNVIAGIDFYSAGYQARYGDRMSGVVDISLREPPAATETELALSFFNTSAMSRGRFGGNDKGDWLVSGRRANLDLLADIVNPDYGTPRYQDYLGHIGWNLGRHYLSANILFAYDKISVSEIDDSEHANAKYTNDILWLKADSTWSESVRSSTILSATEIENERTGTTDKPRVIAGVVDDIREFSSLALKQDWQYDLADRWLLSTGFELKRLEADYRYRASLQIFPPFDQILDNQPSESRDVAIAPRGSQYAAYAELRWRPSNRVTLDAGLRWDQQTYTTADDDEQASPRVNLLYKAGNDTELRLAFGEYYQAQEINELQVSDGLTNFHPAQRAQHLVASLVHSFDTGVELRLEAYQKKYRFLMPRFENIFDPLVLIPELQIDRARIDADNAVAEGFEISLTGGGSNDLSWWASYSWSRAADTIDGETSRRSWDQTHTFSAGLSRDWGNWSASAAALLHTGWPKALLVTGTATNPDGSTTLTAEVDPADGRRHAAFQSLDIRISRRFNLPKGDLTAFLEVTNVYNRENPCCTEYTVDLDADGDAFVQAKGGAWLPIVPSLGVVWRF